ncbi:hypothetical protein [Clostridium sp. HBUAS56010]|uniref:hypothetical protein n=1 Tax=Clostridium sp. HBUAS56010 TaxID=2571127 RepID=UPI001178B8E5|nr:hypothetical protein [Clostridium sp. HBUAS56010]
MSCKDCRNLFDLMECGDINKVSCETHSFHIEEPKECKGYLKATCKDKKKIEKNIRIVTEMYLADQEEDLE